MVTYLQDKNGQHLQKAPETKSRAAWKSPAEELELKAQWG